VASPAASADSRSGSPDYARVQRGRPDASRSRSPTEVGQLGGCGFSAGAGSESARWKAPPTERDGHRGGGGADCCARREASKRHPRGACPEGPRDCKESLAEAARDGAGVQEDQEDRREASYALFPVEIGAHTTTVRHGEGRKPPRGSRRLPEIAPAQDELGGQPRPAAGSKTLTVKAIANRSGVRS
jgi:hypothetical protein